ncbi:MAG: hypothetical protein E6G97_02080 [Alphaproteobacteria bacterium]|nr:MAG: hypothetical protein E6G97_02080 [Alphaproteobacteria bacterium]
MSFNVEFVAPSKAKAIKQIEIAHLPECIRSFLTVAVGALPAADEDKPRFIKVKAMGHLCEGPSSYSVSNAQIDVSEIRTSC